MKSARERRQEGQPFYEALKRAREEDAKLTSEERIQRDERLKKQEEAQLLKDREETMKAIDRARKAGLIISEVSFEDWESRREATRLAEQNDPKLQAFRKEMAELFGPMDPDPPSAEDIMNAYFNKPNPPEVVRQRRETGDYWRKLYKEGLEKGHFRT